MNRLSFMLARVFTFCFVITITDAFQNRVSNRCQWRLYAIDNNDKRGNLTPAQRVLQQTIRKEKNISEFDQFKRTVYRGVDSIQSFGKGKPAGETKVIDGYTERNAALLSKADPSSTVSLFSNKGNKQQERGSPFDQVKSALYGTLDFAERGISNKSEDAGNLRDRVDSLPIISAADANSNGSLLSPQVLAELKLDLKSGNLLKRGNAQLRLFQLEGKERVRLQKLETQLKLDEAKRFVYSVFDGIRSFVDLVLTIPGEAQKAAESTARFAASIPGTIEGAVETVQSIPSKALETVDGIQCKVDETVSTAKLIVADVRDLPNKVQRKTDETKQTIAKAIETVNDAATNVKILVGVEKPKPKPPSTPPPTPPKASDIAIKAAGFVFTTTGKMTWWLGKTVGSAAYNAVLTSLDNGKSNKENASGSASQGVVAKKEPEKKQKVEQQTLEENKDKTTLPKSFQTPKPPSLPKVAKTKPIPPPVPPKSWRDTSESIDTTPSKTLSISPNLQQDKPENAGKSPPKRRELYESSLDEEVRNALRQAEEALEGVERFKAEKKKKKE